MLKNRLMTVKILLAAAAILLAACGGNVPEATPTFSVDQIQTQAVSTFSSSLTLTAIVAPSNTPLATPTPPATIPPLVTSTGGTPFTGSTPGVPVSGATASC